LARIGQIASRASILSLLVLFALGAVLLWRVKDAAAMRGED
jgi:MFS-type transporter involved in bile tolerance (Atg22 family)